MSMTVLLADGDIALRDHVAGELRGFGHQVTCAGDGPEALAVLASGSFEAIVLDRILPAVDGLSVLRHMRREGIRCPVILMTALGRVAEKVEGLDAGADDYLVKPVDPVELDARLRAVRRARAWASPEGETVLAGDIVVSPASHRAWRAGTPVHLSKVEMGILVELARNAGAVVTRGMLYERLWGRDFTPTTNIAEANIRRLRQKLIAGGGTDPIVTVRGIGYKLLA
jgi:two-component system OmpR family response regulator